MEVIFNIFHSLGAAGCARIKLLLRIINANGRTIMASRWKNPIEQFGSAIIVAGNLLPSGAKFVAETQLDADHRARSGVASVVEQRDKVARGERCQRCFVW
jgi:hypothetical protein